MKSKKTVVKVCCIANALLNPFFVPVCICIGTVLVAGATADKYDTSYKLKDIGTYVTTTTVREALGDFEILE